jgi:transmembrane sensor
VAVVGSAAAAYLSSPSEQVYATPLGAHKKIVLADGSQIELNTDTVLRARMTGRERAVTLEKGEAYFQIRHDNSRPFFVTVAGHRVVDLGTKFLVRRDVNRVEVALFEGRARLEPADARVQTKSAVLTPGDVAVATMTSMSVVKKSPQYLASQLPWRHGELIFHFTSLADAAAEFNRYNQRKLVVDDPSVARLQIGGTFGTHDVDLFGHAARDLLGVHVSNRGQEVVISR